MATEFTLNMKMGNAAMLTGGDIAERLRVTANKLEADYEIDYLDEWTGLGGAIRDTNGNALGRWGIEAPKTAEQIADAVFDLADDVKESGEQDTWTYPYADVRALILDAVRAARGER
ncbi:hypothetical protein [uncultured Microbacterium sp.]|uniref:hypothetical protein n=1 Tax=uncultured Microbacterium sp. TaxID=191216 RepID=UPI0025DCD2B5|nr:hypothetical protein [uncultured Microbacterium sp.]